MPHCHGVCIITFDRQGFLTKLSRSFAIRFSTPETLLETGRTDGKNKIMKMIALRNATKATINSKQILKFLYIKQISYII